MGRQEKTRTVINNALCTGCGTCVALCPKEAIDLIINEKLGIYVPRINEERCDNCGMCLRVCPGPLVDFKQLNLEIFKKDPEDYLLGNYLNCYLGYATDTNIRYNSASGGLITQLLISALEKEIINGALVVRMKKDNSLISEPFIARSKQEIIEASRSKYCPVPANIALKDIFKSQKSRKFAVVGLPCHLQGVKKATMVDKELREKIALYIGIFCSHTINFKAIKFLLHRLGIEDHQVRKIAYRGEGWPGKIKITLINGKEVSIDTRDSLWNTIFSSFFFVSPRCLLCHDLTAELSDISCGDAWLPEITSKDQKGTSIIISRSARGEELLNVLDLEKLVVLSSLEAEKVIQSQRTFLHFKKVNIEERTKLRSLFGKKSPQISTRTTKVSTYNKFFAFLPLVNSYFGSRFELFLRYIPLKILAMYSLAFYVLYSRVVKSDFKTLTRDKKGLNILVLHAHWNNRGDEAALRAMIESFRSQLPTKNIKIMLMAESAKYFPSKDLEVLDLYPIIRKKISSILSFGIDIFLILITRGKLAFTKRGRKFISAVHDADVVIHAPGGPNIGDSLSGKYGFGEIRYLYRLLIPILKRKPLFFYAPSMGPFSGKLKNFIRKFILKKANAIIVRETVSKKYLKEQLGLDSYVTIDSAFQNDISKDYIDEYDNISKLLEKIENTKIIGLVIADLSRHPQYKHMNLLKENIISTMSKVAAYLTAKGYPVLLIPQLFGESGKREMSLLENIQRMNKQKMLIIPPDLDCYAQQLIISKLFCVISMRYHPNIFAAKANVPSIAVSYEHKIKGFMEKLGRMDLMTKLEELSASKIIDRFEYLEENYKTIKEQLEKKTPKIKKESQKTTMIIMRKLQQLEIINSEKKRK